MFEMFVIKTTVFIVGNLSPSFSHPAAKINPPIHFRYSICLSSSPVSSSLKPSKNKSKKKQNQETRKRTSQLKLNRQIMQTSPTSLRNSTVEKHPAWKV